VELQPQGAPPLATLDGPTRGSACRVIRPCTSRTSSRAAAVSRPTRKGGHGRRSRPTNGRSTPSRGTSGSSERRSRASPGRGNGTSRASSGGRSRGSGTCSSTGTSGRPRHRRGHRREQAGRPGRGDAEPRRRGRLTSRRRGLSPPQLRRHAPDGSEGPRGRERTTGRPRARPKRLSVPAGVPASARAGRSGRDRFPGGPGGDREAALG